MPSSTPWIRRRSGATAGLMGLAASICIVTGPAGADDAQAREIFKSMTEYVAAQKEFSFDYDTSLDIITTDARKLTIASSGHATVDRPGNIHATRTGGFASVALNYDGKTVTVFNETEKLYAQAPLDGTIDSLIVALREKFGHPLPAADLLMSDIATTFPPMVSDIMDLGAGVIMGQQCDHLAMRTEAADFQIWIAQGAEPYPCRYIITDKSVEGWPDYTVDIHGWKTGAAAADAAPFHLPEGATKVEVSEIPNFDDLAGPFATSGAK